MKFSIDRDTFFKALSHGSRVAMGKTTIPILTHVLIQAKGDTLTLSFTDLEISLVEKMPCVIENPGSIAVPSKLLVEIIRKLPSAGVVSFSWEENAPIVEIICDKADFRLSCLSADDYPVISQNTLPYEFNVPGKVLKDLLSKTQFAMSEEETRYYLNGIFLHIKDEKEFRAVATDGHRLACYGTGIPKGADKMPGIILARKAVHELVKLLSDVGEDVHVSLSATQATFSFGKTFFSSRLVDGDFPNYEAVIPQDNQFNMLVEREKFSDAIDRVATMAPEKQPSIRLTVDDGKLRLQAASAEHGKGFEELLVSYTGNPLEIGFNAPYLMDMVRQISSKNVEVSLKDMETAAIVRDLDDAASVYVLMPMWV